MKLIDCHCHLESESLLQRIDSIVQRADSAGVVKMITCSITPEQWELSESLAGRFPQVEFANGIHPWYIKQGDSVSLDALYLAGKRGASAIGEIGLDKKKAPVPFDIQLQFFEAQLSIAKELGLPVIMHCRGAFEEAARSIKRIGGLPAGGIIHSFSGSAEIAEVFIRLNIAFSLGGILTYRNSQKRAKMLRRIFPDHFLLETDSPDIPPVEKKHGDEQFNEPANIVFNLEAAAELLGLSTEETADAATANAARIFKLDLS